MDSNMSVMVRGEVMTVNVVGVFHVGHDRAYMRITLPNGVRFDHRSRQGFRNPWASTHYVEQVIEATQWGLQDELTPYPLLDSDGDQISLF